MFEKVKNYENYSVNEMGIVINNKTGKVLKQYKHVKRNSGYMSVFLYNKDGRKMFFVHRLVALTFIPNPHNLPQVNHKDENTLNNRVENLEWCDAKYNTCYGTLRERASKRNTGEGNPFYGRKHTEKSKRLMSDAKFGKPSARKKKIIVDGTYIYDSVIECSKNTGISLRQIYNSLNHTKETVHTIEYYKEAM